MRTHERRSLSLLVVLSLSILPGPAHAQDADALRRELEALRQQLATATASYEQRLKALGDRLQQLEGRAAPAAPAPVPPLAPPTTTMTATAPAADAPTLADLARPRQPFGLAQPGRVLLFDIGVSGDFVTDFTSPTRERRHDGTFAGRENRLFPREVELGLFGRVDPYASAVVRISAGEEPSEGASSSREVIVRLDEANATLLDLPLGTTARFGLSRVCGSSSASNTPTMFCGGRT